MSNLWIRSQDREKLTICVEVTIKVFDSKRGYEIWGGTRGSLYILGTYKTLERVLEVLDEIQNILTPRYIVTPESDTDLLEVFYDKKTANKCFYSDQVDIREAERNCIVFEMPKE